MNKDDDTKNSITEVSPIQKSALPKVAARQPAFVKLTKGERYFWCACGLSTSQPFCDGAHKGTEIRPVKYIPEKDEEVFLCQCKHTKKVPFCDGSHSQAPIPKDDVP
jgi:CDGSH-type Zn-finger protein